MISAVHPRMRGERGLGRGDCSRDAGSSPHARGTHSRSAHILTHGRFIPACAGNACTSGVTVLASAVHPRMRGERKTIATATEWGNGSSPHARGTHGPPYRPRDDRRFIPACAGNASTSLHRRVSAAVHPRMRGERMKWPLCRFTMAGSSPHARGTRAPAARL